MPLIDPDEARFARTSVEMARSGDIVVPTFEGLPRLVKPPLLHWIQSLLFRVFGPSEPIARLPSVLATLGSVLILGWIVRRRLGHEEAVWAAAAFVTMPLVVTVGRLGTLDALLAVHVLAAIALDLAEPGEVGAYRVAAQGALLGLAFLVKGPVGVVLPLLVILAGRTATGRTVVPSRRSLVSFVVSWCGVVLPWGLAALYRVGADAQLGILRAEVFERYFSGTTHMKPFWFFAPVALVGFVPWVVPLGLAVARAVGRRADPTALYAVAGLGAGLVFLSLGRGKQASYLAPLAPLVAILVAWETGHEFQERGRRLGAILLASSLLAFGVALPVAALSLGPPEGGPVRAIGAAGAAIYLVGGAAALGSAVRRKARRAYGIALATASGFMVLAAAGLMPALAEYRSAGSLVGEFPVLASGRPVVVVAMRVPSLTYYLDRVPQRVQAGGVGARIALGDSPLFVIDPDDLVHVGPAVQDRLREVGRKGKYRLYESVERK